MNEYTVFLSLPPKELRANARAHWAAKARATKKYRESGKVLMLEQLAGEKPMWRESVLQAKFMFKDRHQRDPSNLNIGIKAAIDGFVDAGLLEDDRWLAPLPPLVEYGVDKPGVLVMVAPITYKWVVE